MDLVKTPEQIEAHLQLLQKLKDYQLIFQNTAEKIVKDCYNVQGLKCDYVCEVQIIPEYDITILPGFPPTILISSMMLFNAIFEPDERQVKKNQKYARALISRAVAKLPKMQRTLSLQPLAEIIAVKQGMAKFVKSNNPEKLVYRIPEHHLRYSSSVTVTVSEITTGQSVTLSGDSEHKLRSQAISQLTQLVSMSQYLADAIESEKPVIPPIQKIHLRGDEVNNEY